MEPELKEKIEATVLEILKGSRMDEATEFKVRKAASEKLGIDLSVPDRKKFVRQVVEAFLTEEVVKLKANGAVEPVDEPEEEDEDEKQDVKQEIAGAKEFDDEQDVKQEIAGAKEFDDNGDLIICKLSDMRRVTIQDFKGKTLVSIREYYQKDGKDLPSSKGISLTTEQWSTFKNNVGEIEKAMNEMKSRLE